MTTFNRARRWGRAHGWTNRGGWIYKPNGTHWGRGWDEVWTYKHAEIEAWEQANRKRV